ncbi:ABC transporter ATP-binding protein [Candidatus Heimdallarchaeota archaeon B3_Heim]|nr:MAG: ABC transporter ATP-binding protein [Candidatus Heimdallarchaeota archaeon B3_Heim]
MLEVTNVTGGYEKAEVIHDISIEVERKEFVSIIGPNGSGKSTLMKTIVGFLKPFSGQIIFDNKRIDKKSPNKIAKLGIGYVPQLNNVFSSLTIHENLEMGAYLPSKDRYSYSELYDLFPAIKGREAEKAKNLSGGERQMLALARAMVNKPALLCLDEPTAALAPKLVREILNKLIEIRESGTTILLIEQNAKQSLKISDRGYVLAIGKKVHEGPSRDLLSSQKIQEHYLGIKKVSTINNS